jgi:hypothetical protein
MLGTGVVGFAAQTGSPVLLSMWNGRCLLQQPRPPRDVLKWRSFSVGASERLVYWMCKAWNKVPSPMNLRAHRAGKPGRNRA